MGTWSPWLKSMEMSGLLAEGEHTAGEQLLPLNGSWFVSKSKCMQGASEVNEENVCRKEMFIGTTV